MALSEGISTYKMHNGHRGINHPVINLITGKAEVTSQNHGFGISEEDIKSLGKTNQIGSHGKSHNPLGVMSNSDLKDEIETSVGILSDICGIRIRSISYPFGGPTAIPTHDEDLKNSDLSFGLTMKRGLNHLENLSAPYLLNRVDTNDAPGGKLNSSEFIL